MLSARATWAKFGLEQWCPKTSPVNVTIVTAPFCANYISHLLTIANNRKPLVLIHTFIHLQFTISTQIMEFHLQYPEILSCLMFKQLNNAFCYFHGEIYYASKVYNNIDDGTAYERFESSSLPPHRLRVTGFAGFQRFCSSLRTERVQMAASGQELSY